MRELAEQKVERKKDWVLTQGAFHQLLNWFGEGTDSGGQKYLEVRQKLVSYFDRKNCQSPDELADETLNRVARRLEEEGSITDKTPVHFCYIEARFVFHEYLRNVKREQASLGELPVSGQPAEDPIAVDNLNEEREEKEKWLDCLKRCAQKLKPDDRELVIPYYYGEEGIKIKNRRALAAKLEISMNALRIRAYRIRKDLETCVSKCVSSEV